MMNFKDIAEQIVKAGAGRQVESAEALGLVVADLLENPTARSLAASNGSQYLTANRGSLDRLLKAIDPLLDRCFPNQKTLL
jgi:3-deoxy-D-manno-octulosonic-acid transferase